MGLELLPERGERGQGLQPQGEGQQQVEPSVVQQQLIDPNFDGMNI